ncbi:MAG: triose-phosphate isomerase [Chitinophagales bacterium]|nr:triose-phosphate isomerase [Chitinophagales bacterium]
MRKKIVAANWKSNLLADEAVSLARQICTSDIPKSAEIILLPPMPYLFQIAQMAGNTIQIGAQNCSMYPEGAYTGEVTARQLKSAGAKIILTGHSERRQLFSENNTVVKQKINRILDAGLSVMFCCGEPLEVRKEKKHIDLVHQQLEESLFHLGPEQFSQVIIAYEPVWAIGTGVVATPDEAQEMHAFIRSAIESRYGGAVAKSTAILYGGSVKPDNAPTLFACEDVDGALVGGASLNYNDFIKIAQAIHYHTHA